MLPMAEQDLIEVKRLLQQSTPEYRLALFKELRATHKIHKLEEAFGAPAEVILEAIHRAPELTRRMLRGVIADAAFSQYVVPAIADSGLRYITPKGNYTFDYKLADTIGSITIQVKLQRSERGRPVVKDGRRYGFGPEVFMVEPQTTRGGTDKENKKTRPYRYGDFDILAVSLQPSTGKWDTFRYTLARWLIQGNEPSEIATMQPVPTAPNDFWTDDLVTAAQWLRGDPSDKRMRIITVSK